MWRRSSGFTLFEVLAALVIWMMIATFLLPSIVRMHQERKGLLLEQQARFFLANELDRVRVDEQGYLEKTMTWQGVEVRLLYKDEQPHSSICVGYSDYRSNEKQRCMYAFLE